ncbi:MAG: universal stress protein, partial [Proteobacteria bacterium]|nr:universal stress protein [Pseudomonadota bacterium]
LSYGKSLASEFDSKLILCHIVQVTLMVSSHMPPYLDYTGIESDRIQYARGKLEKIAEAFDIDCEILVSAGHPADEIEQVCRENNIDMVIAATYGGSGVKRFLIGSVTSRLVKTLHCPLLVLHAPEDHLNTPVTNSIKLKQILVGCDFSEGSKLAFDYALSLAQEFQTQLYLAHVMRPAEKNGFSTTDYLKIQEGDYLGWTRSEYLDLQKKTTDQEEEKRNSLLNHFERQLSNMVPEDSKNWCTPITILLEGQPHKELIDYAQKKQVDMIVLGVHGHSLLEQFLVGSTTDRVISQASCPVLAVRHIT